MTEVNAIAGGGVLLTLIGMLVLAARMVTRMETKVDILYRFWEQKMERRSARDEQAWLAKRALEAGALTPNGDKKK